MLCFAGFSWRGRSGFLLSGSYRDNSGVGMDTGDPGLQNLPYRHKKVSHLLAWELSTPYSALTQPESLENTLASFKLKEGDPGDNSQAICNGASKPISSNPQLLSFFSPLIRGTLESHPSSEDPQRHPLGAP